LITIQICLLVLTSPLFLKQEFVPKKHAKLRHKKVAECKLLENHMYHIISIYVVE